MRHEMSGEDFDTWLKRMTAGGRKLSEGLAVPDWPGQWSRRHINLASGIHMPDGKRRGEYVIDYKSRLMWERKLDLESGQ